MKETYNKQLAEILEELSRKFRVGECQLDEDNVLLLTRMLDDVMNYSRDIDMDEAAKHVGVAKSTFRNYVAHGLMPKGRKYAHDNKLYWTKRKLQDYLPKFFNKK